MSYDEKVDVIDLIINVLREHEKTLDELVSRIEKALERAAPAASREARPSSRRPSITALVSRWGEFRERCAGASLAAFEVQEKVFRVSAEKEGVLYTYSERMPDMEIRFREKDQRTVLDGIEFGSEAHVPAILRGRLECGLEISVRGAEVRMPDGVMVYKVMYEVEPESTRAWLAGQLGVDEKSVIQGVLQI